jgi:hypothetical protein
LSYSPPIILGVVIDVPRGALAIGQEGSFWQIRGDIPVVDLDALGDRLTQDQVHQLHGSVGGLRSEKEILAGEHFCLRELGSLALCSDSRRTSRALSRCRSVAHCARITAARRWAVLVASCTLSKCRTRLSEVEFAVTAGTSAVARLRQETGKLVRGQVELVEERLEGDFLVESSGVSHLSFSCS